MSTSKEQVQQRRIEEEQQQATRLANNTLFVGIEAFKTSIQTARDNSREISRIGVNSSKTIEQVSRDTAPSTTTTTTTSFP